MSAAAARPELERLGRALRVMRHERSLRQLEVAQAAGIAESQLSAIERGKTNPTWTTLERIVTQGLEARLSDLTRRYDELP